MRKYLSLLLFLLIVLGGGTLIGWATLPGEWYAALAKPPFNPPNWIFGPTWSVLYVLIAIAGWRTWRREPSGTAMKLWVAQLILNFCWSPAFFGAQQIGLALIIIAAMEIAILAFIVAVRKIDRISACLFAPYAAWVAFATLLNASIFWLN